MRFSSLSNIRKNRFDLLVPSSKTKIFFRKSRNPLDCFCASLTRPYKESYEGGGPIFAKDKNDFEQRNILIFFLQFYVECLVCGQPHYMREGRLDFDWNNSEVVYHRSRVDENLWHFVESVIDQAVAINNFFLLTIMSTQRQVAAFNTCT